MRDTILVSGATGVIRYPDFGKAECGWVDDWRDFYKFKLPILRLIEFEETEPRPAPGMIEGSICIEVIVYITDAGREALDAWWTREKRSK